MKRSWIKWSLFVLALLAVVIGVPIIINESYKTNSGYITKWGAADVLSYYGTILGALVTITTIIATIGFTRKQIRRESFLTNETEKWSKIEGIIATALDAINPIRPLTETMDTGMTNPIVAIATFQKYQVSCKTATDQLIAFLNGTDYPKVKVLLDCIHSATEEFSQRSDKEISAYARLRDYTSRKVADDTQKMENEHPHAFSEDTLSFCRSILEGTDGVTFDSINEDIASSNKEMISAYETTYKNLLQLKGQTFEAIAKEMQKKADQILHLWDSANT